MKTTISVLAFLSKIACWFQHDVPKNANTIVGVFSDYDLYAGICRRCGRFAERTEGHGSP